MKQICFIVVIISFMLSGCMDKIEAEDRGYVITMGIDKGTEYKYDISFVVAKLTDQGNKGEGEVINVSADNIVEALNIGNSLTNKLLYIGQLKTVIFGKSIFETDNYISDILSQLENNRDVNIKTIVLGTEGKALDISNAIGSNELSAGIYIYDFYKNSSEKTSFTEKIELGKMISDIDANGSTVIPLISLEEDSIKIYGGIIAGESNFKDVIPEKYMLSDIWLKNNGEGAVISDEEGRGLTILDNYCKYSFSEKDNKIVCNIEIESRGSTNFAFDREQKYEIQENFESIVENDILEYIYFLRDTATCDALGFSNKLKKYKTNIYYKYGEEQSFYNMEFEVDCNIEIKSTGLGG